MWDTQLFRLRFAEADATELRIDEDDVRHLSASDGRRFLVDQQRLKHSVVVVGNVRERWAALDVADCVDAGDIRFEAVVHLDKTVVVGSHAGNAKIQTLRRWASGQRQQASANLRAPFPCHLL